jgi:hypothetical protein
MNFTKNISRYKYIGYEEQEDFKEVEVTGEKSEQPPKPEIVEQNFEPTHIVTSSNDSIEPEKPITPANSDHQNDINQLDFGSQFSTLNGNGNDDISGTDGVNTFDANLLLNAKPKIYQQHLNAD